NLGLRGSDNFSGRVFPPISGIQGPRRLTAKFACLQKPATSCVCIARTVTPRVRPNEKLIGRGGKAGVLKSGIRGKGCYRVLNHAIPRLRGNPKQALANQFRRDSSHCMIRAGFLDPESRKDLTELVRDGSAAHRLARRANALLLLDDGMSYEATAKVLYLDDDTVRTWHRLYEEDGIEGLVSFGYDGSACRLS